MQVRVYRHAVAKLRSTSLRQSLEDPVPPGDLEGFKTVEGVGPFRGCRLVGLTSIPGKLKLQSKAGS